MEVERFIGRFVVLSGPELRDAISLYVAHTWAFEAAHATPYLLVVSPEKKAGKSRLLEVLELLVRNPWRVVAASEAATFRKVAQRPTMLLDEVDAIFKGPGERAEALRGILNAGNRPGVSVPRCVGPNRDKVEDFPVYCPRVMAGIDTNKLPDTIRDRSIPVRMQRKTGNEKVERFRYRDAEKDVEELRSEFERWADAATEQLEASRPVYPEGIDDRSEEAWEPLLAIADYVGGSWPERARTAAQRLSGDAVADEETLGTLLLGALRDAFAKAGNPDAIGSEELRSAVNEREDLPFGGFDDDGMSARSMAQYVRRYIPRAPGTEKVPKGMRLPDGSNRNGYLREWFEPVWERWLPDRVPDPDRAAHTPEKGQQGQQPQQAPEGQRQTTPRKADVEDVEGVEDSQGYALEATTPGSTPDRKAF